MDVVGRTEMEVVRPTKQFEAPVEILKTNSQSRKQSTSPAKMTDNKMTDQSFTAMMNAAEEQERIQWEAARATKTAVRRAEEDLSYAKYCEMVAAQNAKFKTDFKPRPQHHFQYEDCCLCGKMIGDDPFGHNPFPLCEVDDNESRCCEACNSKYVISCRVLGMRLDWNTPQEAVEACRKFREKITGKSTGKQ